MSGFTNNLFGSLSFNLRKRSYPDPDKEEDTEELPNAKAIDFDSEEEDTGFEDYVDKNLGKLYKKLNKQHERYEVLKEEVRQLNFLLTKLHDELSSLRKEKEIL